MKRFFCCLAIGCLVSVGVHAEEVVIEGLDENGNLTFNTISNAESYRVEWAPGAGMPWTNFQTAADALDVIPATADPAVTVQIPRLYRVVAIVTNPVVDPVYLVVDLSAGPSTLTYPVSYLPAEPPGGWTDEYKTTKLVLRRIRAGTFVMGSPTGELARRC